MRHSGKRTSLVLAILALTGEPVALRLLRPRFASSADHSYRAALALSLGLLQDRGALKELRKRRLAESKRKQQETKERRERERPRADRRAGEREHGVHADRAALDVDQRAAVSRTGSVYGSFDPMQ